jgi:hypothetical protein
MDSASADVWRGLGMYEPMFLPCRRLQNRDHDHDRDHPHYRNQ